MCNTRGKNIEGEFPQGPFQQRFGNFRPKSLSIFDTQISKKSFPSIFVVSGRKLGKDLRGFSGEAKPFSEELETSTDVKLIEILISRNGTRNLFTVIDYIKVSESKISGDTMRKTSQAEKKTPLIFIISILRISAITVRGTTTSQLTTLQTTFKHSFVTFLRAT